MENLNKKPKGKPLFRTNISTSGHIKTDYGTNDSSKLLETIPNKIIEKNLDEVLNAVKVIDATCDFKKCKTKTNLIGENCGFCKKRYCFKHNLPEVHGCGEAIKTQERKIFSAPKPIKLVRHEQDLSKARKRLENKLKDMNQARKSQQPGTKSKK